MAEWQEEMSSKEFAEWMAYDCICPLEPERGDLQAAVIACVVANYLKGPKGKLRKVEDFLVSKILKGKRTVPKENLKPKLLAWAAAHNATLKARRKKEKKNGGDN